MKWLLLVLFSFSAFSAGEMIYLDTQESKIGFSIIKFKIGAPVEGNFENIYGEATYDSEKGTISNVTGIVFAPSVNTSQAKRDRHLRNSDFFDVLNTPMIKFENKGETKLDGEVKLKGDFTMRGVTKSLTLNMKVNKRNDKMVELEGEGKINRLDYGVSWNSALEKSDWKKVLGILGKTVLDETVTIKVKFVARVP
ncbi:YceI family protein [Bacteriovoracaceae bacterium]|nr:YceI family protein [Bacteriovoracaceae bacterium]